MGQPETERSAGQGERNFRCWADQGKRNSHRQCTRKGKGQTRERARGSASLRNSCRGRAEFSRSCEQAPNLLSRIRPRRARPPCLLSQLLCGREEQAENAPEPGAGKEGRGSPASQTGKRGAGPPRRGPGCSAPRIGRRQRTGAEGRGDHGAGRGEGDHGGEERGDHGGKERGDHRGGGERGSWGGGERGSRGGRGEEITRGCRERLMRQGENQGRGVSLGSGRGSSTPAASAHLGLEPGRPGGSLSLGLLAGGPVA